MYRKTTLALGIAAGLGLSASANAGLWFDFGGNKGANNATVLDVGTFDWTVSSALAVDVITGPASQPIQDGTTFDLLSHGTLGVYLDQEGAVIDNDGNLGTDYEITFVVRFEEVVTDSAGTQVAVFDLSDNPNQINFFEIYIDQSPDSNPLTGSGYNDGTLIYKGTVIEEAGSSFVVFNDSTTRLDNFNDDDYPGVDTFLSGSGSTVFDVMSTFIDHRYFFEFQSPNDPLLVTLDLDFTTDQGVPFNEQDPSECFTEDMATINDAATKDVTTNPSCDDGFQAGLLGGTGAPGGVGLGGEVGSFNGIDGPDFIFQVDASNSFSQIEKGVPAPATIALLGVGLGLLGMRLRRRQA